MTREEAIRVAQAYWGVRESEWELWTEVVRYSESEPFFGPGNTDLPAEPYWYVPLHRDQRRYPYVGASRAILVFPRTGDVRVISYGE